EPTESYSRADLDEYAAILRTVATEAYETPEVVRTAPHRSTVHRTDGEPLDDPARWAVTWRAYRRKHFWEGVAAAAPAAAAPAPPAPADEPTAVDLAGE
ncbi:MAG: hypothetical protein MUC54_03090, partial [Chloroflexi bacterium]|nr:hypothetical protein [Chloroflexota bacterium]